MKNSPDDLIVECYEKRRDKLENCAIGKHKKFGVEVFYITRSF